MTALRKEDVYVGTCRSLRSFVLGWQFGPVLLCTHCSAEDAIDEWDERHGTRVDPSDPTLSDYDGDDIGARIESAIECGDVRINSGGTMVWVDHYEWIREFQTPAAAGRYYREGAR